MQTKFVPLLGRSIRFVNREVLRHKGVKPHLNPYRLRGLRALELPPPPADVDWSKSNTLPFPIDGNDQYGDCYMAAACHHSNAMTGNVGQEDSFDLNAIIQAYLKLSGGDNGLSPDQIYPYWEKGLLGSQHRILDYMPVHPTDPAAMKLAIWLFGGVDFTLGIPDAWLGTNDSKIAPGAVWDAGRGVTANDNNGHAVYISKMVGGIYGVETWALNPPIQLTQAGVGVCDPEAFAVFSLDWFNAQGYAPNKLHYTQLAPIWQQLNGNALPPSPFPAPTPTPGPTPGPVVPPNPGPGPGTVSPPNPTPNLLAQIDDLFDQLERQLRGYPRFLHAVQWLHAEVDALFAQTSGHRRAALHARAMLNPSQLKQLADAIIGGLKVLFAGNTELVSLLTALQDAINTFASSLAHSSRASQTLREVAFYGKG